MAEEVNCPKTYTEAPRQLTVNITRQAYRYETFNEAYSYQTPPHLDTYDWVKYHIQRCGCSAKVFLHLVRSLLPIVGWLGQYNLKTNLFPDIFSGCTVAVMHIPQGMAYAMLVNIPPIYGIYMAFFPVLMYAVFGTSKHVSVGTFAVICIMSGKVVSSYSQKVIHPVNGTMEDGITSIQVATTISLAVGLIQILMYLLRMGILTIILSDLVVSGLTTGSAVYVFTSQIKHILGISVKEQKGIGNLFQIYREISCNIADSNGAAIALFVTCVVILVFDKEVIKPRIEKKCGKLTLPVELLVLAAATVASKYAELSKTYHIKTVGHIPTGLPSPRVPPLNLMPSIMLDSVMIAFVAYAISLSMAKIFAKKHNYTIDPNQEWLAQGAANVFGSMFCCAPVSASLARSLVQEKAGGKTQLASVVSCCILVFVLLFIGPFFEPLPTAALASIIVVALKGMFLQVRDLIFSWRRSRIDATLWLVPFLSTVLLDIDIGLVISIVYSLIILVSRSQMPYICAVGRLGGTEVYKDIALFNQVEEIPCLKVLQVNGILHFGNIENFRKRLYSLVDISPSDVLQQSRKHNRSERVEDLTLADMAFVSSKHFNKNKDVNLNYPSNFSIDFQYIILDLYSLGAIDLAGVDNLVAVIKEFDKIGIKVLIVVPTGPVDAMLAQCGFYDHAKSDSVFPTLNDAIYWVKTWSALDVKCDEKIYDSHI